MSSQEIDLFKLANNYLKALEGGAVKEALQIHADKAEINLTYKKEAETDLLSILNVFKAAKAQYKLDRLIQVIIEEGFNILPASTKEGAPPAILNENNYRKWLNSEVEYVDIRGIGKGTTGEARVFPIVKLYTELYVQTGLSNFDLESECIRSISRTPLTEAVNLIPRTIIMGDPGSGKTTFLRFLAMKHLERNDNVLPILLSLDDLYNVAKTKGWPFNNQIFLDYCQYQSDKEKHGFTREGLEKKCIDGEVLWLLDSLDELPSEEARTEIVDVIIKTARRYDKCRFVLTSRPVVLRGKSVPVGFEKIGIEPWGVDEIRSFLQAWTSLLYIEATEEMRRRHWGELLAAIVERPDLLELAKNAVMVTAMAVVHYNEKRLPEGRADLLEAVITWLVRAKSKSLGALRLTPKFVRERYQELALAMFEAEGGRRNIVGRLWAAEKICKHFDGNIDAAVEFLGREETETGVLVRRGEGDLAFWHLSFQEYLAAKEIAGKTDDPETGWWSKLNHNLDKPEWREVIALVPVCLNRLGTERVNLFFEMLGKSCADKNLLIKASRVALGSQVLRDLHFTDYSPVDVVAWQRVLSEILPIFESRTEDILLETRYEVAVAYGRGGDKRLIDLEKTWVPLPGGKFLMGAQSQDIDGPNYDPNAMLWEGPILEINITPFEIKKYPITIGEYNLFVKGHGYSMRSESLWSESGWRWLTSNKIEEPLEWKDQLMYPNCPVTGISWFEAEAYCNWLTLIESRMLQYRLPSEAEWEYSSKRRIPTGQQFGWGGGMTEGDDAEANWAGCHLRRKTPVGMFPKSTTSDGIADLFGNVEEWTSEIWRKDLKDYPNGAIEETDMSENPRRVTRGGSTIRFSRLCRPTYRSRIRSQGRYLVVGFRPIRVKIQGH